MCGIVGYTGPREAGPILIEGLKRLEYRGYDSAGIALVDDAGDLFVEKRAGKLANLQTALADRTPHAAIGLAHTRWATHGRPNDLNAHPHRDCTGEITVIHNGIIENFRELRDGLEARGHRSTSETDTEAIAHLVEEAYAGRPGRRGPRCAAAARGRLRAGRDAHRRGRPAGRGAQGRAARGRARRRRELPRLGRRGDPRPHATRSSSSRTATSPTSGPGASRSPTSTARRVERAVTTIDWSPEAAEKGGYEHFMLKEIHEQPKSLSQSIAGRVDRSDRIHVGGAGRARGRPAARSSASSWSPAAAPTTRRSSARRRSRPGPGCRHGPTSARSSATRRRRSTSGRWSSPSPSRARRPTRSRRPGSRASAAARSSRSPTRSARRSPARPTRCMFLQAGPEIAVAASKTFVTQVTTLVILAAAIAKAARRARRGRRDRARRRRCGRCPQPRRGRSSSAAAARRPTSPAATSTRAGSCSSGAARPIPPRSRARSSSRRSATSTPRATRRASSSTARSRCSTPSARWSRWRRARRSTTS